MPVIKPRTRGKHVVRHITRLDRENVETLFAYGAFLGEPAEYVLNQLIDTLLARDKEFMAWRESNAGPHTPRSPQQRPKSRARRSQAAPPLHVDRGNGPLPATAVS